jgi:hypothetical protein
MTGWVAAQTVDGPRRIWIELEIAFDTEADPQSLPMALTAQVAGGATGVRTFTLARCSYHPDRLAPNMGAVAAFILETAPK